MKEKGDKITAQPTLFVFMSMMGLIALTGIIATVFYGICKTFYAAVYSALIGFILVFLFSLIMSLAFFQLIGIDEKEIRIRTVFGNKIVIRNQDVSEVSVKSALRGGKYFLIRTAERDITIEYGKKRRLILEKYFNVIDSLS